MIREEKIPQDLRTMVDGALEPGESIKWRDMPLPHFFTSKIEGIFRFGIVLTLCPILWTVASKYTSSIWPDGGFFYNGFSPFLIAPLLLGIALLLMPLWEYRKSRRTVYAITDRRVIICEGAWKSKLRTFLPELLGEVRRRQENEHTGDVFLALNSRRNPDGKQTFKAIGFENIQDPMAVELMLNKLVRHRENKGR